MSSLFTQTVERHVDNYLASPEFKSWFGIRVKWAIQGFHDGFDMKDRERFTATVAKRVRQKARRPIHWLGRRVWRARYPIQWCADQAEQMVTAFIRDSRIKFGDPDFDWKDGHDIADEEMSQWEKCP